MKTIYIEDACCGIKIECPEKYSCMLINDYNNKESILRLTNAAHVWSRGIATSSIPNITNTVFIDICFNSLGTHSDSLNCRINRSEYSYIMKNNKTNITSYRCYSTNIQGDNHIQHYQDNEYLMDQLEPINAVLNNYGVKIETWFIRSDIACSKMVSTTYIYDNHNGSSKWWDELKTICSLTDSELISKKNSKEIYNKRIFSEIKDIIINDPATIILWKDGTKTVVKCQPVDTFDPEKGIAMAILKKLYGNSGFYKDIFEPAIEKYELKKSLEKSKKHVATKKEKKYTVK